MAYNQARFGNSFEFRQSYQLTIINHCSLGSLWENLCPTAIMNGIIFSFFESLTIIVWLSHGGVPAFRRQFFVGCLITLISEETSLTATQPKVLNQIVHILILGTRGLTRFSVLSESISKKQRAPKC